MLRMLSKSRWDEMVRIWMDRHSGDPFWQDTGAKVVMFVSGIRNVRWSAPMNESGIPCPTGSKYKVIDRLRDTLHKNGEMPYRVLIVGNAKCLPPPDIKDYDFVVGFNDLNNKWVLPWITHHWMRSNIKAATEWGGMKIAPVHSGMEIILCDCLSWATEAKKYMEKGCRIHAFNVRALCPEYPGKKCSSTGYACAYSYVKWGFQVGMCGFTHSGLTVHDWEYERREIAKMIQQGKIRGY